MDTWNPCFFFPEGGGTCYAMKTMFSSPSPTHCSRQGRIGRGGRQRRRCRRNRIARGLVLWGLWFLAGLGAAVEPAAVLAADTLTQAHWLERHRLAPDDDQTRRAQAVFARVLAVADRRHRQTPRLLILDDAERLFAFCLPDGAVLLSLAALRHCLATPETADPAAGEARLGFVLAHELGHLADDDYWHARAVGELRQFGPDKALARALGQETAQDLQRKELKADDRGFLYAAMAGLAVHHIHSLDSLRFFAAWTDRGETRALAAASAAHPPAEQRAAMLQSRLRQLEPVARRFQWGVRLLAADRPAEALALFESVRAEFDSREVLHNEALCHYLLGLRALSLPQQLRWWLPSPVDDLSRAATALGPAKGPATGPTRGSGEAMPARERFGKALDLLALAREKDATHWPSRLLGAMVCLRLGKAKWFEGLSLAAEGLEIAPEQPRLLEVEALLTAEAIPERRPWAIDRLRPLALAPPARFNLARLLELDNPDNPEAAPVWKDLAAHLADVPPLQAGVVASRANVPPPTRRPPDCAGTWSALPDPSRSPEELRAAVPSPDWLEHAIVLGPGRPGRLLHLPGVLSLLVEGDATLGLAVEDPALLAGMDAACAVSTAGGPGGPGEATLELVSGRRLLSCCPGALLLKENHRPLEGWRFSNAAKQGTP